ncbi:PspA-associated protein PspAB [Natrinema sp. LN54]|uniref:PspA-associated protein PspAB n=1 Tax=Natrinema sp. LN54 TaxID=3458705 RepID=UPI0040369A43
MGLLDGLRAILGSRAETDAGRDADPDDLFGMSTAYLTMEADLGYESLDVGALCFSGVDSSDFREAVDEVEAILEAGREETGTEFSVTADDHGYHWVVLADDDPEDLITSMHFAADTFIEHGYGSRLLAAVFAYEKRGGALGNRGGGEAAGAGESAYWIYSFRRGRFYPFVPKSGRERDSSAEFTLESALDGELEIEREKDYWYPLWPSEGGTHPWE